ncbi:MAG: hypothetical protein M3R49_07005 [Chloroflexota bacterium]|nr:hypothetical protein [Chloroflexota bacterium]
MTPIQRLVAAAAALLTLLIVLVVVLRSLGAPVALRPSASPSPSPRSTATTSPSASGQPSPVSAHDEQAAFAAIERQVQQIRGLPAAKIGAAQIIGRDQLAVELRALFDAEYPRAQRVADNITLRALGLLGADQDVAQLQLRLLGDQVLGFYDDRKKRMVVVSDSGLSAEARITYAHEYTHALQDAAFTLKTLQTDAVGQDDRSLARTALVEGDATQTMFLWALAGNLDPGELAQLGARSPPDTGDAPSWMVGLLEFPYTAGLQWVGQVYQEGGSKAVDAAFTDPPNSTEQVIHYDKWVAREKPIAVTVPDLAPALGAGWKRVSSSPQGEAMMGVMLQFFGVSQADAARAVAGWGGDRVAAYSGPGASFSLAWRVTWDSPLDATEFADAYAKVIDALPFPARLVSLSATEQLIVHASSDALLHTTLAAAH